LSSPTTSTSILARYLLTYLSVVRPHLKLLIDDFGSTVSRMFLSVIVVDVNCSLCPWALGCLRRPRHHLSLLAATVTAIDSLTSWAFCADASHARPGGRCSYVVSLLLTTMYSERYQCPKTAGDTVHGDTSALAVRMENSRLRRKDARRRGERTTHGVSGVRRTIER
jgi:hypothetical protein